MSTGLGVEQVSAWMRVRLFLDLGDVVQASAEAEGASALTDWDDFGPWQAFVGPRIYPGLDLPEGWIWVEPQNRRLLLPERHVQEFARTSALARFCRGLQRQSTQPCFRTYSAQAWRDLTPTR